MLRAKEDFYFAEVSEMLARAPDVKSPTSRASIYFILTYTVSELSGFALKNPDRRWGDSIDSVIHCSIQMEFILNFIGSSGDFIQNGKS